MLAFPVERGLHHTEKDKGTECFRSRVCLTLIYVCFNPVPVDFLQRRETNDGQESG